MPFDCELRARAVWLLCARLKMGSNCSDVPVAAGSRIRGPAAAGATNEPSELAPPPALVSGVLERRVCGGPSLVAVNAAQPSVTVDDAGLQDDDPEVHTRRMPQSQGQEMSLQVPNTKPIASHQLERGGTVGETGKHSH